jgi:hypothetical protein
VTAQEEPLDQCLAAKLGRALGGFLHKFRPVRKRVFPPGPLYNLGSTEGCRLALREIEALLCAGPITIPIVERPNSSCPGWVTLYTMYPDDYPVTDEGLYYWYECARHEFLRSRLYELYATNMNWSIALVMTAHMIREQAKSSDCQKGDPHEDPRNT